MAGCVDCKTGNCQGKLRSLSESASAICPFLGIRLPPGPLCMSSAFIGGFSVTAARSLRKCARFPCGQSPPPGRRR